VDGYLRYNKPELAARGYSFGASFNCQFLIYSAVVAVTVSSARRVSRNLTIRSPRANELARPSNIRSRLACGSISDVKHERRGDESRPRSLDVGQRLPAIWLIVQHNTMISRSTIAGPCRYPLVIIDTE